MHAKILPRKRTAEEFEMKSLLKGSQTCAVFFDDFNWRPESIDLAKLIAVIKVLEGTGKTPVLGARFQRQIATAENLNRLKTMVSVEKIRAKLVGVLSGPAQMLAGTLCSPAEGLAFTLEGRHKAMEEEQRGKS
jgi:ribosomal protein L10